MPEELERDDQRDTEEVGTTTMDGSDLHGAAPGGSPDGAGDELARARDQAADYEDRWKRATAEFINYKRRTEQERGELLRGANGALILELLPVLDDLERALAHVPAEQAESEWVKGTRLVERKFRTILERQGVTAIEAVVTQEYQRGYRLHGRTLRPAMVVVGEAAPAGVGTTSGGDLQA
jgi:molecular chaperone GrpE